MKHPLQKQNVNLSLQSWGCNIKKLPMAITRHICNATTNIHGKVIKVSVVERVGYGVQITAQGNEKSCLVTYEAMLGMAEAMGLFDEVKEQNND